MSTFAFALCAAWIASALASATLGARRGLREGRGPHAAARLKSPTVYLFAAYLVVAALVTPISPGESTSPLLWLAAILPLAYALATLSAIGRKRRSLLAALTLAVVHGGAVLAAAAIVVARVSPAFMPSWMR